MFIKRHQEKIGNNSLKSIYKPHFFRIKNTSEREALQSLLETKPYISIFDTIESQLKELIRTGHPSVTLTDDHVDRGVEMHLNGQSIEDYGVWVYYPWAERLVHILDETEFVKLRTN